MYKTRKAILASAVLSLLFSVVGCGTVAEIPEEDTIKFMADTANYDNIEGSASADIQNYWVAKDLNNSGFKYPSFILDNGNGVSYNDIAYQACVRTREAYGLENTEELGDAIDELYYQLVTNLKLASSTAPYVYIDRLTGTGLNSDKWEFIVYNYADNSDGSDTICNLFGMTEYHDRFLVINLSAVLTEENLAEDKIIYDQFVKAYNLNDTTGEQLMTVYTSASQLEEKGNSEAIHEEQEAAHEHSHAE